MSNSNLIDHGGNTLIVSGIRIADTPGQAGTDVDLSTGDLTGDSLTLGTLEVTGPVGAATAAGTGAGSAGHADGAVATHVLAVDVNGTTYYIPLCNTNA